MFNSPFDFSGRIRRKEYGLSVLLFFILEKIINAITDTSSSLEILNVLLIPLFWFIIAQGVKRCHDVGKHGWWQVVPFYVFALIFTNGQHGENEYGTNPKEKLDIVL